MASDKNKLMEKVREAMPIAGESSAILQVFDTPIICQKRVHLKIRKDEKNDF